MISAQEDDLAAMRRQIDAEESGLKEQEADIAKKHGILSKITTQLLEKTSERNQHAEDRRERWRAIEDIGDKVSGSERSERTSVACARA